VKKKKDDDDLGHPSEDGTGRFAIDQLLRVNGFKIHERLKHYEPVWERFGKFYPQSQAVATLDEQDVADAKYKEELYHYGYPS